MMPSRRTETHLLPPASPGSQRFVRVHRYGAGQPRKVYIQAALHADETPAQLVALRLLALLEAADQADAIRAEIVVVPAANPIGLAQHGLRGLQGRYHQQTGRNFNRGWPDLADRVGDISGMLGDDADENVVIIRAALAAAAAGLPAVTEEQALRRLLACEAVAAELVLDLHCDDVALPYLYTAPQSWPALSDLAARLGAEAVLLAEDSGGGSFDEALSLPWLRLACAFPDRPIPQATDAVTVELRGAQDVSSALAGADARAIFDVLVGRGLIVGEVQPAPALRCEARPTAGCQQLRAAAPGIVVYAVALGDRVRKGDRIADVLDPTAEAPGGGRVVHEAGTDGLVLALRGHRAVVAGQVIARIAGSEILRKDRLLAD